MFATAQSIAMGGGVPAVITVISAGTTGITAAAAVKVGLKSSIHHVYTAVASPIGVGIHAVVNKTAVAAAKFHRGNPPVLTRGI